MLERITEIAGGIIEFDGHGVGCSIDRIDGTINAGEKKVCTFFVTKEGGALNTEYQDRRNDDGEFRIKGVVYSSDHRVKVNTETFSGFNCRIEYEIDASELRNGDVIEGNFSVITNCGEWFIPYCISVIYVRSELVENMRSLESFSDFAKENCEAALRLCESSEFLTLPFMENTEYAALYQALRPTAGRNNLLEEFLIGTGMKYPVTVSITDAHKPYVRSEMRTSDYINICRDTWGFVQLNVSTDSDFIILMKDTITSEDFADDIYALEYKIDEGRLHSGLNMGRVIIESVRQRFVINIKIDAKGFERSRKSSEYRKHIAKSMKYYVEYCTKTDEADNYLDLLRAELYELIPLDEKNSRIILAIAWYNIMKGDVENAQRVLSRIKGTIVDEKSTISTEYCILYYLCYIMDNGTATLDTLLKLLYRCYEETGELILFQMLLNVEPFWADEPLKRLEIIRQKFDEGCHAPWLYIEACKIYVNNPELIEKLESFELNCLWFGAKEGIISIELAEYVSAFAVSMRREINWLYLRMLFKLYESHGSESILKAICNVLLKGDVRSPKYFEWYERGIEQDIRLTKLYEYYIYSMPQDYEGAIPRKVLLYFSYTSSLDVPSRITIYRNVVNYYSLDEQIRISYAGQIEAFVIDQLLKGYIDEGMAELYNNILYEDMVDNRISSPLAKMLYAAKFCCTNKKIRKLVVCYKELNQEQELIPWNGVAYTVLPSDNFIAVGVDIEGRRYVGLDIKVKNVFKNKSLLEACKRVNPNQELIKLRDRLELIDRSNKGDVKVYGMLELLQSNNIRYIYKADIVARLAAHCRDNVELVPETLLGVDKRLIGFEDRDLFVEMLTANERYQRAFELMRLYGWENISDKSLVETVSRMIVEFRFDKNVVLLNMARDCFLRGCFNQRILEYLLYNYNGDSRTMLDILRGAEASGCRKFDFAERIFSQLMFTGNYEQLDEVFAVYSKENQKDETVVQAYLAIKSRDYLLKNGTVLEDMFEVTEQFIRAGRKLTDVTKLALCKYYSTLDELSDERRSICSRLIYSYCRVGVIFSFYQKLGRFIKLPDGLEDKVIVEYQAEKDSRVMLRSRILPDDIGYLEEMIPHMFEGFFVKVITLLRKEILEYEIVVEGAVAASGKVSLDDDSAGLIGEGRNIMINRMLDAKENNDLGRVILNAQSYALLDGVTDKLFTLL